MRKNFALKVPCLVFALVVLGSQSASPGDQSRQVSKVPAEDIPEYFVVAHFFDVCHDALETGGDSLYWTVLRYLGLEAGSPAADAVEEAALKADLISKRGLDLRPYVEDPEQFHKLQSEFQRRKVRQLAAVYNKMLGKLAAEGFDRATLEDYLATEIVPGIALYSTDPAPLETELRAFDEESAKSFGRRDGSSPERRR